MSDYLFDGEGSDSEVEQLEQTFAPLAHDVPLRRPLPARSRSFRLAIGVASALAAGLLVAVGLWQRTVPAEMVVAGTDDEVGVPDEAPLRCAATEQGFAFSTKGAGLAMCGGAKVQAGVLPVGAWLETTPDVAAELVVADIGRLTIHGVSRLRLLETGPAEHRLELERGHLSASVLAPPRLFVVDTPAATAVDLGCAYELDVDAQGRTRLRVTSGAVSLELGERIAWVPMGYEVMAAPGRGPGLPVSVDAVLALREAARRFDGGDMAAVAGLVEDSSEGDVGMLWNLLARSEGEHRALVFARLSVLRPLPDEVTKAAVLAGDEAALERWREALEAELLQ